MACRFRCCLVKVNWLVVSRRPAEVQCMHTLPCQAQCKLVCWARHLAVALLLTPAGSGFGQTPIRLLLHCNTVTVLLACLRRGYTCLH